MASFFEVSGQKVGITQNEDGWRLTVDDQPYFIKGVNWDYFPIGTNYEYNLWEQSDLFIQEALESEMQLLKEMGGNAIRIYVPMPKRWITYIYEKYGVFTVLNHSFGRYGLTIDGNWLPKTDYGNPAVEALLLNEMIQMSKDYQHTPGLLLFLLGNENNYGLFWEGAETEDVPDAHNINQIYQATAMYSLIDKAALEIKKHNPNYPVAICNGDIQFLDIIATQCTHIDIFGMNIYRGVSFGNTFDEIAIKLNKPVLLTEFGSDAYNAVTKQAAQEEQALILTYNWKEIYKNAAGHGKAQNAIGGLTFQFSDGWWKHGQTHSLDVHDTHASWSNGGYLFDYQPDGQNMNEEWFGICAKGETKPSGHYTLKPRKAYYSLQNIHRISPYDEGVDAAFLNKFFETLHP